MRMPITANHFVDDDGNPAGGTTFGQGFCIGWQNGPLSRGDERREPNGAFVQDIIAAAVDRLVFYQRSRFFCHANAVAIEHLHAALGELRGRTAEREHRGVEGTHAV